MAAGRNFSSFLRSGARLFAPANSKLLAPVAAAAVGAALLAGPAIADPAPAPDGKTSVRIINPANVPPYAEKVGTAPTSAAPKPATSRIQANGGAARPAPQSASAPKAGSDHPDRLRDSRRVGVQPAPVPLPPVIGGGIPAPGNDAGALGYAAQPSYGAGRGNIVTVPQNEAAGAIWQNGPREPIPPGGRDRDHESRNGVMMFGGEVIDLQVVNATIAGARIAGVKPMALFAMQSRSQEAMSEVVGDNDDTVIPNDGPYAFDQQVWLSAMQRFGRALGIADASLITRMPDGRLTIADHAALDHALNMRADVYISSVLAGANLAGNDERYRRAFGQGPNLAELMVGHHCGADAMLQVSSIARQAPGTPLAAVLGPERARQLVHLTGFGTFQPDGPVWSVGGFLRGLDNSLKNAVTRYAETNTLPLPPDYKPDRVEVSQRAVQPAPTPRF